MRYLTYDEAGNVTGAYLQDLHPDHVARHVEVSVEQYSDWVNLIVVDGALQPKPTSPPVPYVPQEVTMRQARQQLIKTGKLAAVNAALAGMAGEAGELARAEWEYSTVIQRNRPLVLTLGSALGIDLDAMFIAAAAL